MGRPHLSETKRQGGLSLIPSLWAAIDEAAALAGVPRNRIIERVLMERFGFSMNSQMPGPESRPKVPAGDEKFVEELSA